MLRRGTTDDAELLPLREALEARLGVDVIAVTLGSMNSVAAHGVPGVEVATVTVWTRGADLEPAQRRTNDALIETTVAEFGPWPWQQFTARATRLGGLPPSRARRIAALAGEYVADPIIGVHASFDEAATTKVIAAIPQERWRRFRDEWGPDVWTVAANAELHRVSVFVHTEQQAESVRGTPRWLEWEQQLGAFLDDADEFGATGVAPITIGLESRESFKADYQGNWSYYWY